MRIAEFVIQGERPLQLRDSLIILTRHHERATKIRIDDERKGGPAPRLVDFR